MQLLVLPSAYGQPWKQGKLYLNEDGSHYVKLTLLSQVWVRAMEYNPGTLVYGFPKESGLDIGIRRYRVQFMSQLNDRVFVYSQFGENNFSALSVRKGGFFVHDALGEYALMPGHWSLGAGLTGWGGFSRFSAPSVGTLLGLDAPLFLQTTNDVTDQFLRKLSVYTKGKAGPLDFRFSMVDPMAVQQGAQFSESPGRYSNFSARPPHQQWTAYVQWQFLDKESNLTPYMPGTYLGTKRVFQVGIGSLYQAKAMWHLNGSDTIETPLVHLAFDLFYDAPTGMKGQALSLYLCATYLNFGPGYLRNLGVMNPGTGSKNTALINGGGNAFPAFGTGTVLYGQAGYLISDLFPGTARLMPYAAWQHARYERLQAPMNFLDLGVNLLLPDHSAKFTLAFQQRPVFAADGSAAGKRSAVISQFQASLN